MGRKGSRARQMFESGCVQLIFLLSALLILLLGIRAAAGTIALARAERIEIINNLVEGLSESEKLTHQSKKVQTVVYEYVEALLRAVAGFEFVPRNDFTVLAQILNTLPEETEVLSFVYHGRDLTVRTAQPSASQVLAMVGKLKARPKIEEEYENVVYSYYIAQNGQCIAEVTLVARRYDEQDLVQDLLPAE